jgi:hypothetical protein
MKMGPIGCPETSVKNYHTTLHKISKEGRCYLHRFGILKSCEGEVVTVHAMKFIRGRVTVKVKVRPITGPEGPRGGVEL